MKEIRQVLKTEQDNEAAVDRVNRMVSETAPWDGKERRVVEHSISPYVEASQRLAKLALQSERYTNDAEYKEAVDAVIGGVSRQEDNQ